MPLHGAFAAHGIPTAQDHLAFLPARLLAILANSLGTLAVVGVALRSIRKRPLGNALIVAGIAAAAIGQRIGRVGRRRQRDRDRGRRGAALRRIRLSLRPNLTFRPKIAPD